jgi:hypothetical protein
MVARTGSLLMSMNKYCLQPKKLRLWHGVLKWNVDSSQFAYHTCGPMLRLFFKNNMVKTHVFNLGITGGNDFGGDTLSYKLQLASRLMRNG